MVFGKKKDMIDIRDIPKKQMNLGKPFIPKDGYGFVDLTIKRKLPSQERAEREAMKSGSQTKMVPAATANSFNFFDAPTTSSFSPVTSSSSGETEEMLRKISMQISDLDSKMYKMEQRIELLERKAGVGDNGSSSSSSSGGFNW